MSGSVADAQEERFKILDTHITVTVKGEQYRFKIPTMAEYVSIGSRAAAIRRSQDPMRIGNISALDVETADTIWGFAAFEVLLDKTSIEWPVSKSDKGEPTVDHTKFPLSRMDELLEVVYALNQALVRFRAGGAADNGPAAPEVVAGQ